MIDNLNSVPDVVSGVAIDSSMIYDLGTSIDYSEDIYLQLQEINQTLYTILFLIAAIFLYHYIKSIWRVKGR